MFVLAAFACVAVLAERIPVAVSKFIKGRSVIRSEGKCLNHPDLITDRPFQLLLTATGMRPAQSATHANTASTITATSAVPGY